MEFPSSTNAVAEKSIMSTCSIPHHDNVGNDMVTLKVGQPGNEVIFTVHKRPLCRRIPYFDKMFNSEFSEGQTQVAHFPDDYPESFDILIEWLYNFNYPKLRMMDLVIDLDGTSYASWDGVSFYALAEKLIMPELMDLCVDAIIRFRNLHELPDHLNFTYRAYDETSSDGKLRLYASYVFHWLVPNAKKLAPPVPMAEIQYTLAEFDGLMGDFLVRVSEEKREDLKSLDRCMFHMHGENDICTTAGKKQCGGKKRQAEQNSEKRAFEFKHRNGFGFRGSSDSWEIT